VGILEVPKDSSTRALFGFGVLALVAERILRREYCLCGRPDVNPYPANVKNVVSS
jgi:hypothetical protein